MHIYHVVCKKTVRQVFMSIIYIQDCSLIPFTQKSILSARLRIEVLHLRITDYPITENFMGLF